MNTYIKQDWLDALRSGKYTQTKEVLKDSRGYCCLGVLCDILYPDKWRQLSEECYETAYGYSVDLPMAIKEQCDIENVQESTLIDLNDVKGKNFSEIADYIETNL
jgi:hypothetical protein